MFVSIKPFKSLIWRSCLLSRDLVSPYALDDLYGGHSRNCLFFFCSFAAYKGVDAMMASYRSDRTVGLIF